MNTTHSTDKSLDDELLARLGECHVPGTNTSLFEIHTEFDLEGSCITATLPIAAECVREELASVLSDALGDDKYSIKLKWRIRSHHAQDEMKPLPNIKNIIAVASGKGGVGKSTVAANLALALEKQGATVGLLDADIYGPSVGHIFSVVDEHPESVEQKYVRPVEKFGLQLMSMGVLVEEKTPMVWRGPMASRAMQQLLTQTLWQDLDYLVVDLPPGTGDIQLTLAQSAPVTGAVLVTTPQDLALLDVKKAIEMFNKVNISIIGMVENMAVHTCENCGHEEHIFGEEGAQALASRYDTEILGSLPLDRQLLVPVDKDHPLLTGNAGSATFFTMEEIALKTAVCIAKKPVNLAIPNISSS